MNYKNLAIIITAVIVLGLIIWTFYPSLLINPIKDTKDVSTMTDEQKKAANMLADSQDTNPNLRETLASNTPIKSGCTPKNLPMQLLFTYNVQGKRPNILSAITISNPEIQTHYFANQGILDYFLAPSGTCEYFITSSKAARTDALGVDVYDVLYYRVDDVRPYGDTQYEGHASYNVPDNDCNEKVDPHDVVLIACCKKDSEAIIYQISYEQNDKCIIHTYGYPNN